MSPEPPARMPDIVQAFVRHLAAAQNSAGAAQQQVPPLEQVVQSAYQLLDAGAALVASTRPAGASVRRMLRDSARRASGPSATVRAAAAGARRSPRSAGGPAAVERLGGLAVLPLGPVPPGEKARGELRISNDSRDDLKIELKCGPLSSSTGILVPGSAVSINPTPIEMPQRSARTVDVNLIVPDGTQAGLYVGLLTAVGRRRVRMLIALEVE